MNADRTRRGMSAFACLSPALLSLALTCAAAGAQDLVRNGTFEHAEADDANRPAGWKPHVSGKSSVAWPAGEGRGGSRCLRMAVDPNDRYGHAYWSSDPMPLRPCMAYRVRFHYRCTGHGVPCFTLMKVKDWRLFRGDTKGQWLAHDDVVVAPPDVTQSHFLVHNYHRPGKTIWMDDLCIVELPLSESPLTKRLAKAKRSLSAIEANCAKLHLSLDQAADLRRMREGLAGVATGYARLAEGAHDLAQRQFGTAAGANSIESTA